MPLITIFGFIRPLPTIPEVLWLHNPSSIVGNPARAAETPPLPPINRLHLLPHPFQTAIIAPTAGQVNSPAIQAILESVVPKLHNFPTASQDVRVLQSASSDACAEGETLSIEDHTFLSTSCYVDTAIDEGVTGFLFTETGLEPETDGTGWEQAVTFAVSGLPPSTSSSSSSGDDTTTTTTTTPSPIVATSALEGNSIGDRTTDDNGSTTSGCEDPSWIADGICDFGNNEASCDYDGGDCCECTCVDEEYICGEEAYECVDPSAPCNTGGGLPVFSTSSSATEVSTG